MIAIDLERSAGQSGPTPPVVMMGGQFWLLRKSQR
jgi:hypothetical protein